jgi:hypothetical protein
MADTDDVTPGWPAIDAALERLYPGVEPKHCGTLIKWRLGGPDPLDGLSVFPRDDQWCCSQRHHAMVWTQLESSTYAPTPAFRWWCLRVTPDDC